MQVLYAYVSHKLLFVQGGLSSRKRKREYNFMQSTPKKIVYGILEETNFILQNQYTNHTLILLTRFLVEILKNEQLQIFYKQNPYILNHSSCPTPSATQPNGSWLLNHSSLFASA